jgi:hypothetical protein
MAQTFRRIVVDGFRADDFDFAAALQRRPGAERAAFEDFVSALVVAEGEPDDGVFWSVTIVGHSDRFDVAGPTDNQRRARELDASRQRRDSAGSFLFTEFQNGLSDLGLTPPATLDDPTNVGFSSVLAGAADLVHPTPASEAERQENRRVKFLAICFAPQPLAITFGEQLDRNVA